MALLLHVNSCRIRTLWLSRNCRADCIYFRWLISTNRHCNSRRFHDIGERFLWRISKDLQPIIRNISNSSATDVEITALQLFSFNEAKMPFHASRLRRRWIKEIYYILTISSATYCQLTVCVYIFYKRISSISFSLKSLSEITSRELSIREESAESDK